MKRHAFLSDPTMWREVPSVIRETYTAHVIGWPYVMDAMREVYIGFRTWQDTVTTTHVPNQQVNLYIEYISNNKRMDISDELEIVAYYNSPSGIHKEPIEVGKKISNVKAIVKWTARYRKKTTQFNHHDYMDPSVKSKHVDNKHHVTYFFNWWAQEAIKRIRVTTLPPEEVTYCILIAKVGGMTVQQLQIEDTDRLTFQVESSTPGNIRNDGATKTVTKTVTEQTGTGESYNYGGGAEAVGLSANISDDGLYVDVTFYIDIEFDPAYVGDTEPRDWRCAGFCSAVITTEEVSGTTVGKQTQSACTFGQYDFSGTGQAVGTVIHESISFSEDFTRLAWTGTYKLVDVSDPWLQFKQDQTSTTTKEVTEEVPLVTLTKTTFNKGTTDIGLTIDLQNDQEDYGSLYLTNQCGAKLMLPITWSESCLLEVYVDDSIASSLVFDDTNRLTMKVISNTPWQIDMSSVSYTTTYETVTETIDKSDKWSVSATIDSTTQNSDGTYTTVWSWSATRAEEPGLISDWCSFGGMFSTERIGSSIIPAEEYFGKTVSGVGPGETVTGTETEVTSTVIITGIYSISVDSDTYTSQKEIKDYAVSADKTSGKRTKEGTNVTLTLNPEDNKENYGELKISNECGASLMLPIIKYQVTTTPEPVILKKPTIEEYYGLQFYDNTISNGYTSGARRLRYGMNPDMYTKYSNIAFTYGVSFDYGFDWTSYEVDTVWGLKIRSLHKMFDYVLDIYIENDDDHTDLTKVTTVPLAFTEGLWKVRAKNSYDNFGVFTDEGTTTSEQYEIYMQSEDIAPRTSGYGITNAEWINLLSFTMPQEAIDSLTEGHNIVAKLRDADYKDQLPTTNAYENYKNENGIMWYTPYYYTDE